MVCDLSTFDSMAQRFGRVNRYGDNPDTRIDATRRYARLQSKYGRWGLAYLESLLRAADTAASAGLETDDDTKDSIGAEE